MSEPDCPKCPFTPMEPVTLDGGVSVDECPECKGRWFDLGELARASKRPGTVEEALRAGLLRPRPGSANCPRCLRPMTNGGLGSEHLRVDACPDHGVWLDAGEGRVLETLLGA